MSAPTVLRERSAYRASWPLGKAVIETEPEGKAAQEILEFDLLPIHYVGFSSCFRSTSSVRPTSSILSLHCLSE